MGGHLHHGHDASTGRLLEVLPPAAVLLLAVGYVHLAHQARYRNRAQGWSRGRTGFFLIGCVLLADALLPPLALFAHGDFRGHMLRHLLIGMYAPLAFVLAVPVTLLLRTLTSPCTAAPLQLLAHPVSGVLLSTAALAILYLTPLYDATTSQPVLHGLLHAHLLLSGCLFAWVTASPDPAPTRSGVRTRLVVLGVAVHATIAQLLYGAVSSSTCTRPSPRYKAARRSCPTATTSPNSSSPPPSSPPGAPSATSSQTPCGHRPTIPPRYETLLPGLDAGRPVMAGWCAPQPARPRPLPAVSAGSFSAARCA